MRISSKTLSGAAMMYGEPQTHYLAHRDSSNGGDYQQHGRALPQPSPLSQTTARHDHTTSVFTATYDQPPVDYHADPREAEDLYFQYADDPYALQAVAAAYDDYAPRSPYEQESPLQPRSHSDGVLPNAAYSPTYRHTQQQYEQHAAPRHASQPVQEEYSPPQSNWRNDIYPPPHQHLPQVQQRPMSAGRVADRPIDMRVATRRIDYAPARPPSHAASSQEIYASRQILHQSASVGDFASRAPREHYSSPYTTQNSPHTTVSSLTTFHA
ncbi:hypothetical protein MRB53_036992 [Persea americana]|nr:hypothetical protein MRB53_036992 [Persea americana]